mgnify:FL=1
MDLSGFSLIDDTGSTLDGSDSGDSGDLFDADIDFEGDSDPIFGESIIGDDSESLETLNLDSQIAGSDDGLIEAHGTPSADSVVWHQQTTDFSCGVVSSEMVMKMFGLEISEAQLVYEATTEGILTDNGMSIEGIQQILYNHGIATKVAMGDISDLSDHLDQGHKIIVGLDSGELWGEDPAWEDWVGERADHAVVVTGVDDSGPFPTVTINDPGHPDGKAMVVDLETFMDAWNDSRNEFITTVDAPST